MKKIFLLLLPVAIAATAFYYSQKIDITGVVTDPSGNGITAQVFAGKVHAKSNAKGYYHISVDENNAILHFSATGYQDQDVSINGRKVINVTLQQGVNPIDENVETEPASIKSVTKRKMVSGVIDKASVGYASPLFYESDKKDIDYNTEDYDHITENEFKNVSNDPLSTFSIDVDPASYSNVRRFLVNGQLPPAGAVRTEEMINYFKYNYPQPVGSVPFSVNTALGACPWNSDNKLLLIGLQGKNIPVENLPASNLVFLIDVSGSMMDENKLPLVKASLKMLTGQLRERDRISLVVYAGNAGLVLPATSGSEKNKIKSAIDALEAGGSTAGGEGIQLAYATARKNFMKEGNNRIILCTDGDFNVGASSDDAMARLVEKERNDGIYLTVLGYGMGNYKDNKMEQLADKGNGNHAYIDGINEAKKVLVNEFGGTLFTIAKDVKLQVEFNPALVAGYRLIGYENRMLNKEDFNDDKKDAGEMGSGHTVTALYEIIPVGVTSSFLKNDDLLKYQSQKKNANNFNGEMATVKLRYKDPAKDASELVVHAVSEAVGSEMINDNLKFTSAVAGFGMLLRDSEFKGNITFEKVLSIAKESLGQDKEGYRKEFIDLVKRAESLKNGLIRIDRK